MRRTTRRAVLAAPFVIVTACGSVQLAPSSDAGADGAGDAGIDTKSAPPSVDASGEDSACPGLLPFDGAVPWAPPTPFGQSKCTDEDILNYGKFCLGSQADGGAACRSFLSRPQAAACVACLTTPADASALGPLITQPTYVELNYIGCLANFEDGGAPCAHALKAKNECDRVACTCLRVPPNNPPGNYCQELAEQSTCAPYAEAGACADRLLEAGIGNACFGGRTFDEGYVALARLFCGPRDAGRD